MVREFNKTRRFHWLRVNNSIPLEVLSRPPIQQLQRKPVFELLLYVWEKHARSLNYDFSRLLWDLVQSSTEFSFLYFIKSMGQRLAVWFLQLPFSFFSPHNMCRFSCIAGVIRWSLKTRERVCRRVEDLIGKILRGVNDFFHLQVFRYQTAWNSEDKIHNHISSQLLVFEYSFCLFGTRNFL